MANYEIAPWVAVIVIVLSIWRAFHGPYSDQSWRAFWSSRKRGD